MPRRRRHDEPGCLHHVTNRGQDRQRIFSHRRDYRFFLALLACAVRAGRIRVHAYCLMPNHFHLLVESLDGDLSTTMKRIQGRYGGYYNRSRKHTGHTFEGRFHSFPVTTTVYLHRVIRYIDRNPWKARRRQDPLAFAWGSAAHHARSASRPLWLARDLVGRFLENAPDGGPRRQAAYRRAFGIGVDDPAADDLVEARMSTASRAPDGLDALVVASADELAEWLKHRATSYRSTLPLAMVDTGSVLRALAISRSLAPPSRLRTGQGRTRDPWPLAEIGLLRDLAGITLTAAAAHGNSGPAQASKRYALHRAAVLTDEAYLDLVASAAHRALELAFGVGVRNVLRTRSTG